jgi:hypothetical protein
MNEPTIITLVVSTLIVAGLVRGFFTGYAPALAEAPMLGAKEQAVIAAAADAFFPRGGLLPVSGTEAGTLAYLSDTLRDAPPRTRFLMRLLFVFVEHGPWIFNLRARLTRQTPAQRVETLQAWADHPIYFLRVTFTSLRTLVSLAYLSNSRVVRAMGAEPNTAPFLGAARAQESAA